MLLSIIVPFYGVEAYLPACLEGLSHLPPELAEILLVDDCGTDHSLSIAEAWANGRSNARVLRRKQNGGLSAARNTGLEAAKGEYLWFLDSDDIPETDALLYVAKLAKKERLDVAKARFRFLFEETGALSDGPQLPDSNVVSGMKLFADECESRLFEPMVWQCLYRSEFIRSAGLVMAEGMLFEDELFQTPALLLAERAASFSASILRYRQREGSIMSGFAKSAVWCEHYLEICRRLSSLAGKTSGEAGRALSQRVASIAVSLGRNIKAYKLSGSVRKEAETFFRQNREEICSYTLASPDWIHHLEGHIIRLSPDLYLLVYGFLRGIRWRPTTNFMY